MKLTHGALLEPYRVLGKLAGPPPLAVLAMSELRRDLVIAQLRRGR
jgi:hypothetical protein